MEKALRFYKVMAYITGTTLLLLAFFVVLHSVNESLWNSIKVFRSIIGIGHGVVLYPIYMAACFNLILKARIKVVYFFLMLIAGFVPLLAFIMERYTEKNLVPRR
jgi:integral membrane protein